MSERPTKGESALDRTVVERTEGPAEPQRADSIPRFPPDEAGAAASQEEAHEAASDNSDAENADRPGPSTGEQGEDPERTGPGRTPYQEVDEAQDFNASLGRGADAVSNTEASVRHNDQPVAHNPDAPDPLTAGLMVGAALTAFVADKASKAADRVRNWGRETP